MREREFLAESAMLNLENLFGVGFSVVENHSVPLSDGLALELGKLEVHFEQLRLVGRGHDHAPLLLRGDSERDGVREGEHQEGQQLNQSHLNKY